MLKDPQNNSEVFMIVLKVGLIAAVIAILACFL